jgi:hypothetical protein
MKIEIDVAAQLKAGERKTNCVNPPFIPKSLSVF